MSNEQETTVPVESVSIGGRFEFCGEFYTVVQSFDASETEVIAIDDNFVLTAFDTGEQVIASGKTFIHPC